MPPTATGSPLDSLGSKMNARSFWKPSPLMSPATIGVNGCPERNCPNQLTRTASQKLYPRLYTIWWRESYEARPHSTSSGLPTVLEKPRNRSRMFEYTYEAPHVERGVNC